MPKKKSTITTINTETIPINNMSKEDIELQKLLQLQFANLAKLVKFDLNNNKQVQCSFHKNFNKDDVLKWLGNPQKFQKQLRKISRFLYDSSSHYKRLVQYFSTMLTFDYVVEPYGEAEFKLDKAYIDNMRRKYINIANLLDVMNLKHEFLKVCERAWIDDIAYYYELKLKDSYFLMQLNPDYCEISGIEDGCLTFSYDFMFFDKFPEELKRYPDEFNNKYDIYKENKKNYRWQEIDPSKSLCIKIAESVDYPIPPFCGIFEEVYAIEDYKQLNLTRAELENYLILIAKIPYLKDNNNIKENAFALTLDIAKDYFNRAMEELPTAVGGMLSPFESIEAIKVDRNDKSSNYVSEAQKSLYDAAGVSQLLFNSTGTGAAITKSIKVDESISFKVLRQFERWVNKKLKDENKGIKFKVSFLDMSLYSRDDYIKELKEGASLGVPNKLKYASALGQSPSSILHMEFLENSVLGITDSWKPLQTSYTLSDKENGRTQNKEDDLSPEGETTRANDGNNPDNRAN